jgi:hypothetical protein
MNGILTVDKYNTERQAFDISFYNGLHYISPDEERAIIITQPSSDVICVHVITETVDIVKRMPIELEDATFYWYDNDKIMFVLEGGDVVRVSIFSTTLELIKTFLCDASHFNKYKIATGVVRRMEAPYPSTKPMRC